RYPRNGFGRANLYCLKGCCPGISFRIQDCKAPYQKPVILFNPALLKPEVQEFIKNYSGDVSNLAFRGSPFHDVSVLELMLQIESRSKTEKKLPSWFNTPNVLFPPKLNLEQTSSEITAKYKACLLKSETMADITGGFGVDCFYFANHFNKVFHFETN